MRDTYMHWRRHLAHGESVALRLFARQGRVPAITTTTVDLADFGHWSSGQRKRKVAA